MRQSILRYYQYNKLKHKLIKKNEEYPKFLTVVNY